MPTAVKFATRADPPYEINGNGTPVNGSSAIIEDKFIAIWIPNQEVNPIAKILPKLSEQSCAILRPLNTTKKNNPIKTAAPKKPNSSPTIPNIESVETSGIYSNFCLEWPNPKPNNPPDPRAIKTCDIWYVKPCGSEKGSKKASILLLL